MSQPQRKILRTEHLDANVASTERALLARARALDSFVNDSVTSGDAMDIVEVTTARFLAGEFRTLAEELHWW